MTHLTPHNLPPRCPECGSPKERPDSGYCNKCKAAYQSAYRLHRAPKDKSRTTRDPDNELIQKFLAVLQSKRKNDGSEAI